MFAVPKYSQALEKLRRDRGVEGLFRHNLVEVDARRKVARFEAEDDAADAAGQKPRLVEREFDFLHVVPPQKPWSWVAKSPLGRFFFFLQLFCFDLKPDGEGTWSTTHTDNDKYSRRGRLGIR